MKTIFSLSALFLSISLLFLHSTSYTTAKVKNETNLSIVSEEESLVAIHYTKGKQFEVKNNTAKTINVDSIKLINGSEHKVINLGSGSSSITPGEAQTFNLTGDPKKLAGKELQIGTHWNGGSAKMNSIIPQLKPGQKDDEE